MSSRIYAAEDDDNIREILRCTLESYGYEVEVFESAPPMLERMRRQPPDLVLMDIMMPELDGFSTCLEIRKFKEIPVIMLSARGEEYDRGLDLGAEDYITKPFGLLELAARVRAALRRQPVEHRQQRLTGGDLVIDLDNHEVTQGGQHLDLTLKEYELLRILLSNSSRVVPRDELLGEIWGFDFVGETRTLDMHIKTLRAKLHDDVENPRYIKTVRSVGYKFIG